MKRYSALLLISALSVLAVPAHARRERAILNVVDPMPPTTRSLSLDRIEALIVSAGGGNGWFFQHIGPGHMQATYRQKTHAATVDVTFDRSHWRITYVSSQNLGERGDQIHRHYNTWVQKLERSINVRLSTATQ